MYLGQPKLSTVPLPASKLYSHIPSVCLVRAKRSHKPEWQQLPLRDRQAAVALQFVLWAGECDRPDADLDHLIKILNDFISGME